MAYFIEAIRDAAEKCDPRQLKDALDFIVGLAAEEYKGGTLDVTEYGDIVDEYDITLKKVNAINWI